jgi:iron(III) transport system permease protein
MRWRNLLAEFLLLAFFLVFLLYPLGYIFPGAFSDQEFEVRLLSFGESPQNRAQVLLELSTARGMSSDSEAIRLPFAVSSFPSSARGKADELAGRLRKAGGEAEVARTSQPTLFYFQQALGVKEVSWNADFPFIHLQPNSPTVWQCLGNSLALGFITTLATTVVSLPLACWFTRYRFWGKTILSTLLLVPLVVPPFVGAIGLERFLDRYGSLNLWLMKLGIWKDTANPIDWLGGGGFTGVVLMQVLHLFPVLYLNLAASWANIDPTLEDAARNLGASEARVFRTITFPLLVPGYFAGASLVFVWAFTDLGTPLVFNQNQVIPVQIYDQVSDPQRTNAVAYALVVVTLLVTAVLFYLARWVVNRRAFVGGGKGAVSGAVPLAGRGLTILIYATVIGLTLLALLPDIGVLLTAVAKRWSLTPLPESYTTEYLQEVWSNRVSALSIRNSIFYSACSTSLDLGLGVLLAWLVVRRPSWLANVLDGLAMLPLALPGLVLAFGYLTCYSNLNLALAGSFLDPTQNPALLLIVAYTVRRLPYLTRSAQAGLQQVAPVLEEAAENLGAGRWRVLRTITLPLIAANLLAGAILTFAFALLEVSDSLMLAREERYFPITRAILGLLMRPDAGDNIASALAVFAMALLAVSLLAANIALGRRLGELFKAS